MPDRRTVDQHRTFGCVEKTRHQAHECGFSATRFADQRDGLALFDLQTYILEHGLPADVLPSVEKACHQEVLSKLIPMLKKHPVIARMEFRALLLTRDEDDELKA